MPKRSRISYENIFADIAKNRKDSCEVIRELISNSYDANASEIYIYPLLQYEGFIFFDNGIGLSEKDSDKIKEITPYESFFSIGISTKDFGRSIGYKCQGAKLCFDSGMFALITRCENEDSWRWKRIDNPKSNLNPQYSLDTKKVSTPWKTLQNILTLPDERTKLVLEQLQQSFFFEKFLTGTMVIIHNLNVRNFSEYYSTDKDNLSYIRNYIRYNTKHGDVRILSPQRTGFPRSTARIFEKEPGYRDDCKLFLWTVTGSLSLGRLETIVAGYPYLNKSTSAFPYPADVSRLLSFKGDSRHAKNIHVDGRNYCLILAIDGNKKALLDHKELDRQGPHGKRSGIRLVDQKGTIICSQGVRVCQYDQIYEHSKLIDYEVLSGDNGKRHYVFMINGNFELVMNRNFITEDAQILINSDKFIDEIKKFLDETRQKDRIFDDLIRKLKKEYTSQKKEMVVEQLDNRKYELQNRGRFIVNGIKIKSGDSISVQTIEQLNNKIFVEPEAGEEHWVGALYTLFAHFVSPQSPNAHLWVRPLTYSGIGIDSLAEGNRKKPLDPKTLTTVEYKFEFPEDIFNHQLILTEHIICWQFEPTLKVGTRIDDCSDYFGEITHSDELNGLGYEIRNIQHQYGEVYAGVIKVLSLKNLIQSSFGCKWTPPCTLGTRSNDNKQRGKKSKK